MLEELTGVPTVGQGEGERDPFSPGTLSVFENGGVPKRSRVPQNRPHRRDVASMR